MISHSKPTIHEEDIEAVRQCLASGMIAKGKMTSLFEKQLSNLLGVESVNTTESGTSALVLALRTIKVNNNTREEVLIPTYVCESVRNAVYLTGAKPIYYDHTLQWMPDINDIRAKINDKTLAIIAVHTLGISFAKHHHLQSLGVPIIEDACQCIALSDNEDRIGKIGDFSIYSFNATKCLTTGEGGAVVCNNKIFQEKLNWILSTSQNCFLMPDLNAALGISQLRRYPAFLTRRKEIADRYIKEINPKATIGYQDIYKHSIHYRFLLEFNTSFEIIKPEFEQLGIQVRRPVDALLHSTDGLVQGFKNADTLYKKTISIPIYPSLEQAEIEKIINTTNKIMDIYES